MNNNLISEFSKEITKQLSVEEIFFYWKARVGLFTLLKAMDIKEGDEVILPAFTCVVVPNAILYLGATPIYIDVSPDSYNFDIKQVKKVRYVPIQTSLLC